MSPVEFSVFDKFQNQAVACIHADFSRKRTGRYLLVVPTGGGKTFTAVKAVTRLFEDGVLSLTRDRVAWVAHREELLEQAAETFDKLEVQRRDNVNFRNSVDFLMLSQVRDYFRSETQTKLVVIDEAHHGAAPSYLPIFELQSLGVLGLTATPTRHDGAPLEFERESFSIGFPDLVALGVVLSPRIINIAGGSFDFSSLEDKSCLEQLNTPERNKLIIDTILEHRNEFQKVVVFVGTKDHVRSIYRQIRGSALAGLYDSIAWITGDGNSRNQSRAEFLKREKQHTRSILINIQVLSEGYDDPTINTIVMACPTRSKLIYMQSMGRAIRRDPANEGKTAYIVEVTDDLPNIQYRIDNRWLYADVSDALEPCVVDIEFGGAQFLVDKVSELMDKYSVSDEHRPVIEYDEHNRYGMLLFRVYSGEGDDFYFPILVTKENRVSVSRFFNFLSERMTKFVADSINARSAFQMVDVSMVEALDTETKKRYVFDAMANSARQMQGSTAPEDWITFVSFREIDESSALPNEFLVFIEDMINRDEIETRIRTHAYEDGTILLRLPLPLGESVGKIMPLRDFEDIQQMIERIQALKEAESGVDHRAALASLLDYTELPLEGAYFQSLPLIVRDGEDFSYPLDGI